MHDVSRLYMQGCSDGVFTFKGIAFHNWRGVANYICYLQGLLRLADLCADPLCGVTPRSAVSQTLNWKMSLDDDDEDDERDYVAMMQRHQPHHRGSSGSNSVVPEGCEAMAMVRRILRRLIAASAPPKQGDYNNTLKTSFWPSIPWAHRGWTTRSAPTRGQDSPIWGSHQTAAKAWRQAPDNHDGRGAGSSLFLSLQG